MCDTSLLTCLTQSFAPPLLLSAEFVDERRGEEAYRPGVGVFRRSWVSDDSGRCEGEEGATEMDTVTPLVLMVCTCGLPVSVRAT